MNINFIDLAIRALTNYIPYRLPYLPMLIANHHYVIGTSGSSGSLYRCDLDGLLSSFSRDLDLAGLGWGPRICISHWSPGCAAAAGLGTTL